MSEPPADNTVSPEPPMIDVTPDATSTAPPPRRRLHWHDARWVVLGVALLGVALFAGKILLDAMRAERPPVAATSDATAETLRRLDERLATLAQRQAALDQHLARLEQPAAPDSAPTARQEELEVLRQLADRLSALEQHAGAPADAAELAALRDELHRLGDRLDKLEAAPPPAPPPPPPVAQREQSLLLALAPLEGALRGTRPFAAELAALESIASGRPEVKAALAPLEAVAPKGMPALAALTRRFENEVAPAVMRRTLAPPSEGWGERVLGELRGLVVVRRTGSAGAESKDPVEAALARAETALAAGDLGAAVAALEGLPPHAAAPAQDWLAAAKSRLAAEAAVVALERLATADAPEH
jgi:hypothetical protein